MIDSYVPSYVHVSAKPQSYLHEQVHSLFTECHPTTKPTLGRERIVGSPSSNLTNHRYHGHLVGLTFYISYLPSFIVTRSIKMRLFWYAGVSRGQSSYSFEHHSFSRLFCHNAISSSVYFGRANVKMNLYRPRRPLRPVLSHMPSTNVRTSILPWSIYRRTTSALW